MNIKTLHPPCLTQKCLLPVSPVHHLVTPLVAGSSETQWQRINLQSKRQQGCKPECSVGSGKSSGCGNDCSFNSNPNHHGFGYISTKPESQFSQRLCDLPNPASVCSFHSDTHLVPCNLKLPPNVCTETPTPGPGNKEDECQMSHSLPSVQAVRQLNHD